MRRLLTCHPDSTCAALERIEVDVARGGGGLTLTYAVWGRIGDLRLPPGAPPARSDALWRHTCLEAFLRAPGQDGYCEFNFAPSAQWAAYRFETYRGGMKDLDGIAAPSIAVRRDEGRLELRATLDLAGVAGLDDLPAGAAGRLGLAAVIEEANGRLSYWALAHAPGRADFHHADCFALELPAA